MKNIKVFITILLFLQLAVFSIAETEEKESFYKQLSKAICQLEHYEKIEKEGMDKIEERFVPEGTAFFVRYEDNLYIVSAKHVVDQPYDLHAKVKCKNRRTNEDEITLIKLPKDKWIFHSDKGDKNTRSVDVAVMKIFNIKDRQIKHFSSYSTAEETKDQFAKKDPEPPTEILIFGFPVNLGFELKEEKNPMGRKGIVSMVMEEPFIKVEGKYFDKKAVLVDLDAFPGNSGSPAFSIPMFGGGIELVGLLIASNLGGRYAVIEPISRIKEVLEIAKDERNKATRVWFVKVETQKEGQDN